METSFPANVFIVQGLIYFFIFVCLFIFVQGNLHNATYKLTEQEKRNSETDIISDGHMHYLWNTGQGNNYLLVIQLINLVTFINY